MQTNAQHPTIFSFAPQTLDGTGPGTQSELRDRKNVPRPFTKVPTAVGPCLGLKDNNSTSPEVSGSQAYRVWVSCCRIRFLCRGSSPPPPPPAFPQVPSFPPPGATRAGMSDHPDRTKRAQAGSSPVRIKEERAPTLPFGLGGEIGPHRQTPKPTEEVEGRIRHAAKGCQEVPAARDLIGTL